MSRTIPHPTVERPLGRAWGAGLIGFAFGGFFDGILLHQIFQWHHLLSGLDDPAAPDLRFQVVADGLFHAAMYLVALIGLALLWLVRTSLPRPGAGLHLVGWFMAGFGLWHVVDAVLVHWILGLHHIRQAADDPLGWDILFFLVGLAFLGAGLAARRIAVGFGGRGAAAGLAALTLASGVVAAEPFSSRPVLVAFPGDRTPAAEWAALQAAGARVIDAGPGRGLWTLAPDGPAVTIRLLAAGALPVGSAAGGCLTADRRPLPVGSRI